MNTGFELLLPDGILDYLKTPRQVKLINKKQEKWKESLCKEQQNYVSSIIIKCF